MVGPSRPLYDGCTVDEAIVDLHDRIESRKDAPCTMQRLCEVLIEPQKQYKTVEKLLVGLRSIMFVSSHHENVNDVGDELPLVRDVLSSVNDNPTSPWTGQPPAPPLHVYTYDGDDAREREEEEEEGQQQQQQQQQGIPYQ